MMVLELKAHLSLKHNNPKQDIIVLFNKPLMTETSLHLFQNTHL